MNQLSGKIQSIESSENLSFVEVNVDGDIFSSIVLETPQTAAYLRVGQKMQIIFKETEVAIAKNLSGEISLRNRQPSVIKRVIGGKLLTQVVLDYKGQEVVSVISTRSAMRMLLKVGDQVEWLVKTNEISLVPGT